MSSLKVSLFSTTPITQSLRKLLARSLRKPRPQRLFNTGVSVSCIQWFSGFRGQVLNQNSVRAIGQSLVSGLINLRAFGLFFFLDWLLDRLSPRAVDIKRILPNIKRPWFYFVSFIHSRPLSQCFVVYYHRITSLVVCSIHSLMLE